MRLHGEQIYVATDQVPEADRRVLRSLSSLRNAPARHVTADRYSGVSRVQLQQAYFAKFFRGSSNRWRYLVKKDRFSMERDNLSYFSRLGLATPAVVAHGYRARFGLLQEAVLVTREVAGACNLLEYIEAGQLYQRGVAGAREVLGQVADALRLLHQDGFYAADLKPRNILVQHGNDAPRLLFFDCPRGYHPIAPLFLHKRMKDLAYMHRDLVGAVRKVDLMWAYKRYLGRSYLLDADRRLALRALRYYETRRMTSHRKRRRARRTVPGDIAVKGERG